MLTFLSPSRIASSTPVTTMVWVTFQLAGVKTRVVVDKPTSAVSALATRMVTLVLGFRSSITKTEAVIEPDSFTVIRLFGLTL